MTETEKVKEKLKAARREPDNVPSPADMLSTGSAMLNLACSGRVSGGWPKGYYIYFIGDSDSGKTFFTMTGFAEAAINPRFNNYRLIYDPGEYGAQMDLKKYFGEAAAKRIEPPAKTKEGADRPSESVEEFYYNLDDALTAAAKPGGRPFIYVLDSMDALSSKAEAKKFAEKKKAHQSDKKTPGDYGDGKAKVNSAGLRRVLTPLQETGSILVIINQTRDNPAAGQFESSKTHSGGHALTFYSSITLWSSPGKVLKKKVRGKDRQIGRQVRIDVKRSRLTGKQRSVTVPIYYSYGIDDIGSCVSYLADEGHWPRNKDGVINAEADFGIKGFVSVVVKKIEDDGKERELRRLVQKVWNEVEAALVLDRKKRY